MEIFEWVDFLINICFYPYKRSKKQFAHCVLAKRSELMDVLWNCGFPFTCSDTQG